MSKKEEQKRCPNCDEWKSVFDFHRGVGYCKECASLYSKEWKRKRHLDEKKAKKRFKMVMYDENYTADDTA